MNESQEKSTSPTPGTSEVGRSTGASQAPAGASDASGSSSSVQLKASLRSQPFATQMKSLTPHENVQRHGEGEDSGDVHAAASRGIAGSGGSLPHLSAIQQSFGGHDVSAVQGHVGGAAREASQAMGAEAYATGNDVAFAETPSLHTAAHEAAHVVQQRAGVSLSGGVGESGDRYEQHADAVADAVVQGKSAEPILDQMSGGGGEAVQRRKVQRLEVQRLDPADSSAPPDPSVELTRKVDADAARIKAATDLPSFAAAVGASTTLVGAASRGRVATRVSRLMNAYGRAAPVWATRPPVGGKSAIDAHWNERLAMVLTHLPTKAAAKADAAATAMRGKPAIDPAAQMEAHKVFNDVIFASGFKINTPETQADAATIDEQQGVAKCFDVGDFFWKMDNALRARWTTDVGKSKQEEAQALYTAQAKSKGAPPTCPPGKEADPFWSTVTVDTLYTGTLTGFVGMGRDAGTVGSYAQAIDVFALNREYYKSGAMFMVTADAASVKAQVASGALKVGKPSIFCHLEFEEFLYAENDATRGELAQMNPDGSAKETHNGVKEMSCVGLAKDVWKGAKFLT